jgi:Cu/Ag efflux protein CusF
MEPFAFPLSNPRSLILKPTIAQPSARFEVQMLIASAAAAFAAAFSPAVGAQTAHAAHHGAAVASTQAPMTNGVVKRVDKAAGSLTIAHEPLANLGMPAMTMSFAVRDRAWLTSLKEGAKIRFVAESVKGELVVVALEAAK